MESYTEVLTLSVEAQHWTGPVLQLPPDVGVEAGAVTVTVFVGVVAGAVVVWAVVVGAVWPFEFGMAVARILRESAQ